MSRTRDGLSRRRFAAGAAFAGLASTIPAPFVSAQGSLRKLKVGFSGINEYTGLFVAQETGLFAKQGLDVEPILMANNSLIPAALMSNSIDIGTPGICIFLVAIDAGLPLRLISGAGLISASRPTVGLLARADSKIEKAADFKGKRVVAPGLNNGFHVTAREWMRQNGQDPAEVNWVEGSFAQMPDLLKGGQVDAVVAGEPIRGRIISQNIAYPVGDILKSIRDPAISGTYATTAAYAAANPTVVKGVRVAIAEAHVAAKANPEAATLDHVAKYLKLPLEVLKQIPSPNLEANLDPAGVAYWIEVMVAQKLMKRSVDPKTLILA
jgi:NitT/TauT family transport system substrate-binding protein